MRDAYEVVIIGSGFGGAITGCRLAQAGRSVAILEQGRRWPRESFPRSPGQLSRSLWIEGERSGFIEYRAFRGMDLVRGVGVGGGSLAYFGATLRAVPRIFEQTAWPAEIRRDVLDPYYDVVKDMLDAAPLPDSESLPLPERIRVFLEAARGIGLAPELMDLAIYVDPDGRARENPHSGLPQSTCDYSSNCLLGCRPGAKNSLDVNYLPAAERHGAEIHPLHRVEKIEPATGGGYRVHGEVLDAADPGRSEPFSVAAERLVVAGGVLGSTELLLRCRDLYRTLPDLGPRLGSRFSGNGDFAYAASFATDHVTDPSQGPAVAAVADASTADHVIAVEELGYPNPLAWLLAGTLPSTGRLRSLLATVKGYVRATLGLGIDPAELSERVARLVGDDTVSRTLPYIALGSDAADGELRLGRDGRIQLRWSARGSMGLYREMEKVLKRLSRELGGEYLPSPLWGWPLRKTITGHPLGGCPMGERHETGVVDARGEVWRYPGLYVIDGAMVPTALGINPSMTIGALAERASFWMIHGREMEAGDGARPRNR